MILIILIFLLIILYVLYNKNNKKINNKFKPIHQSPKENLYLINIFEKYANQINLHYEHPIFSHNNIRLKCIYAGIRDPFKQKIIILLRYLLIIPGAILGVVFGNFVSQQMNMSFDIKLLFIFIILGAVLGYFFPVIRLDSTIEIRRLEIKKTFPDFIDIMLVCVNAGMTADQAYVRIIKDLSKFSKTMTREIEILSSELTYFLEPKTAYDNFYLRTQNDYIRAYVAIVLQSIQYGTPLSTGLRSLSEEVREKEMGEIEKKAAALPSKLTVPMMIFTFPVLFVVIGFPAAMQVMPLF